MASDHEEVARVLDNGEQRLQQQHHQLDGAAAAVALVASASTRSSERSPLSRSESTTSTMTLPLQSCSSMTWSERSSLSTATFSRQSSDATTGPTGTGRMQVTLDDAVSVIDDADDDHDPRRPIQRVASEQLLARSSELSQITAPMRTPSMSMGKVTSRRHLRSNPRRFVVTELPPDQDGFLSEPSSPTAGRADEMTPRDSSSNRSGSHQSVALEMRGSGDGGALVMASSSDPAATATCPLLPPATRASFRPSKMEVRGRFTIIDLSPDSPATSRLDEPPLPAETMELSRPLRGPQPQVATTTTNGTTRRRPQQPHLQPQPMRRSSRSEKPAPTASTSSSAAFEPHVVSPIKENGVSHGGGGASHKGGHHHRQPSVDLPQQQHHHSQNSPLRVDLSGLDRHLVFLQQESHDMKALLESMISSNARWISALASSSSSAVDSNIGSGKNPKAVHPASSPTMGGFSNSSAMSPLVVHSNTTTPLAAAASSAMNGHGEPATPTATLEQKHDKLQQKYTELEDKYNALLRERTQLQRNNIMLDTRLRQETSVNEELRAHVDQLTQYTESLILGGDMASHSHSNGSSSTSSISVAGAAAATTTASSSPVVSLSVHNHHPVDEPRQEPLLSLSGSMSSIDNTQRNSNAMQGPSSTRRPLLHERSVSDLSVDSTSNRHSHGHHLWMEGGSISNQSELEDDDGDCDDCDDCDDDRSGENDDSEADGDDGADPHAKMIARYRRRRRARIASRSASLGLLDDDASSTTTNNSVYSNSFRDSWLANMLSSQDAASQNQSQNQRHHPRTSSYDWRQSISDDGVYGGSGLGATKARTRTDSGLRLFGDLATTNNQTEDEDGDGDDEEEDGDLPQADRNGSSRRTGLAIVRNTSSPSHRLKPSTRILEELHDQPQSRSPI